MDEAIRQIHNTAMDLSELAKIKQARDGIAVSQTYLKAAYDLELYAISKLRDAENEEDLLWKHTLIQSAGWLALKCGYLEQAKQLVEEGMGILVDGYAKSKMQLLKEKVETNLKERSSQTDQGKSSILGFLASADFEANQIDIKEKDSNRKVTLQVSHYDLQRIVQLFLGTTVEIETTILQNGAVGLADIRWAA